MTTERPVEVELKFRVADEAAGFRYITSETIGDFTAHSAIRTNQIEDRYVDTPDGGMGRAGFVARLRHGANGTLVTVKSTARRSTGRVHRREELESPAIESMVPADWPASPARSLVLELAGDARLVELVTIRQLRTQREFADGETVVELSLDQVDVVAHGSVVERFVELEAELVKGDEALLAAISDVLAADGALSDATDSKLDRAMAAAGRPPIREPDRSDGGEGRADLESRADAMGRPEAVADHEPVQASPPLVVGKTPGVTAEDSVAEAGRKVLRFHLARMLAKEAGVRTGDDLEDVHQMRVATRRMRAAWRVFGDGFRPGRTKRHRKRLREIASRLGAVRDLDVLIEAADKYRADFPAAEKRALEPLVASWHRARDDARNLLVHELDSDGYVRWVEIFRVFVQTEGSGALPVTSTSPHRIRDTAPQRIWAAYEHVRAYEPVLRWADVTTLHELRIAAKWLRYTMEFVREALGPDVALLIERVTALQDHLGALHDADVAASMGRSFLVEHAGDLGQRETAAIGRYLVACEKEVQRLRRSVGVPWRAAAGLTFRRRLGRVTAAL